MRMPRLRLTIGRMIVVVLLAGLTSWYVIVIIPLIPPTLAEQRAELSFKRAELDREVAEFALKEYLQGGFSQVKAKMDGQISLAKSDLERATDRAEWSNDLVRKGGLSMAANIADRLSLEKARFELEQARTKREVLMKYTRDKTIKELTSEIQKAQADEQSRLATYRMKRSLRWRRALGF